MSTTASSCESPGRPVHQEEGRRSSRYDVYEGGTRPFGESYRNMGCAASRGEVAAHEASVKGSFRGGVSSAPTTATAAGSNAPAVNGRGAEVRRHVTINNTNRLSDFEVIYGEDRDTYGDVYSEVRKREEVEQEKASGDTWDYLMQQIRESKEETFEVERNTETPEEKAENTVETNEESRNKSKEEEENNDVGSKNGEGQATTTASKDPTSFIEEEYAYEPSNQELSSKLVVRSRSLAGLEQTQLNNCEGPRRPNAMKITTKPDGSIRYGVRQGVSDPDLTDSDESPTRESEVRNNYVSSIKSAFDAAEESQRRGKMGRAEAFDGLRQYFHENKHGLQELLINNNVVIIEPFRHEPPPSETRKDASAQRTCRITGATVKSPTSEPNLSLTNSNTLPRRSAKSQPNRQGFYHPIKVNKEIIDTELPDPEKVKSAREWFEKIFKSKSSSEVPSGTRSTTKSSFFNTITSKMRITPEVKVVQEGRRPPKRWTDSGSLSSGVSSDFSCDQDYHDHDNSSNPDILEEYSTEDEEEEYDDERHPVSSEVLQKIRACGTTVTYYGGKVISRSHGQLRSPMTMSIMDEIRQSSGNGGGRKSSSEEPYLGVKFRLVKSNSCGSRLEIAGTEEERLTSPRQESIAEEEEQTSLEERNSLEEHTSLEERAEADRYDRAAPPVMTWADLKLQEARKQWHCAPEAVRPPPQDMQFETFEVLDESKAHGEAGRG